MGAAMVRGYQGDDLAARDAIAATAKHFVAYGQPEGGRDYNTVDVSSHRLRNVYLEPFRAAVDAGVASVMASFNTVAGVPMHANRALLTDVLKDEWGFDGVVVGDADGVRNLLPHGVAENLDGCRARVLSPPGLDVEMGGAPSEVALTPESARSGARRRCRRARARPQGGPRTVRRIRMSTRASELARSDRGRPRAGPRRRGPRGRAAEERRHAAARAHRRASC